MLDKVVADVSEALRARGIAPARRGAPARRDAAPKAAEPARVFVTAEMLLRRLAAAPADGPKVLELAHNELLTPAARDIADERRLTVRRQEAPVGSPAPAACPPGGQACQTAALGVVIERGGAKVAAALAGAARDGVGIVNYTQTDCWVQNALLLCRAVAGGAVRAGVLMLPHAADAMVLANKVPGIRAVQGTRADSVAAARRHFAANVLVVEHAFSTLHEMRTMVRSFAAAPPPARPPAGALMEAVDRLERQER